MGEVIERKYIFKTNTFVYHNYTTDENLSKINRENEKLELIIEVKELQISLLENLTLILEVDYTNETELASQVSEALHYFREKGTKFLYDLEEKIEHATNVQNIYSDIKRIILAHRSMTDNMRKTNDLNNRRIERIATWTREIFKNIERNLPYIEQKNLKQYNKSLESFHDTKPGYSIEKNIA